jgi:hypothetical protein
MRSLISSRSFLVCFDHRRRFASLAPHSISTADSATDLLLSFFLPPIMLHFLEYNLQPLVAALSAVVGLHTDYLTERLSELIVQIQSMSVFRMHVYTFTHTGSERKDAGRN